MRVAFHFDEAAVPEHAGWFPLQIEQIIVLQALLKHVPAHRRHVRLRAGIPGASPLLRDAEVRAPIEANLWNSVDCWSSFNGPAALLAAVQNPNSSVVLVEGLAQEDAVAVHRTLDKSSGYFGAMQLRLDYVPHSVYYGLPLRFRLTGKGAELLESLEMHPDVAGSDERDHTWRESVEAALGVPTAFAYVGLQETIFDPYDTPKTDESLGKAERLLTTYVNGLVDEVLIWSRETNPELSEILTAALTALESNNGVEQLAHVALSCRRALTCLADSLYPARASTGPRKLGPAAYRNRLWAYAEERLGSDKKAVIVLTTLVDVGERIDALDSTANKGLHRSIEDHETQRLVVSLLTLIYDLIRLSPPTGAPASAYEKQVAASMRDMLRRHDADSL